MPSENALYKFFYLMNEVAGYLNYNVGYGSVGGGTRDLGATGGPTGVESAIKSTIDGLKDLTKVLEEVSKRIQGSFVTPKIREVTEAAASLDKYGRGMELFGKIASSLGGNIFSPISQGGAFLKNMAPMITSQMGAALLGAGITTVASIAVAVLATQMVSQFVAATARKVLETGGPVGVMAYGTAGFGEAFSMSMAFKNISMQVAGMGTSLKELDKSLSMMQKAAIETTSGIQMLGGTAAEQAYMSRKFLTETFPAMATKMQALYTATGITSETLNDLRRSFMQFSTNLGRSWDDVMQASGALFKRMIDINKSLGDIGFSFDEYKNMLISMTESGRYFGVNINTASGFVAQFARELRTGVVTINDVTQAFKRLLGETSIEGQMKRVAAMMTFGPPEIRGLVGMAGGPLQAIPLMRILQSTAYGDLSRAAAEYRRIPGYEDVASTIEQLSKMGRDEYQRLQVALRSFFMTFAPMMGRVFGGGFMGMAMGEILGGGFGMPTFYPTGIESAYRTAAMGAGVGVLAGRPAEPIVTKVILSAEEKRYFEDIMFTALDAMEKKATFFDKVGQYLARGLFGKDFRDAVRKSILP